VHADPEEFLRAFSPQTIREFHEADLIVVNGAGYEKWIEVASLPESRIVDTSEPFRDELIETETTTHSHGPAGAHEHKGIDGRTWVDPVNARIQAGETAKAMKKRFPEHAAAFEEGWKALASDLDGLNAELSELTERVKDLPLLASRPAYNYLRSRYNWKITNLDLDPEEMPSEETFAEIKALLGKVPAKHILWEARPKEEIAKRFKEELAVESIEFSPCELLGDDEIKAGLDYLKVMKTNIENVRKALE